MITCGEEPDGDMASDRNIAVPLCLILVGPSEVCTYRGTVPTILGASDRQKHRLPIVSNIGWNRLDSEVCTPGAVPTSLTKISTFWCDLLLHGNTSFLLPSS
jgi:hypothetical protein